MRKKHLLIAVITVSLAITSCGSNVSENDNNAVSQTEKTITSNETNNTTAENDTGKNDKEIAIDNLADIAIKIKNSTSLEDAEKLAKESFALDESSRIEKSDDSENLKLIEYSLKEELALVGVQGGIKELAICDGTTENNNPNYSLRVDFNEETLYDNMNKMLSEKYGEPSVSPDGGRFSFWEVDDKFEIRLVELLDDGDNTAEHTFVRILWS